MITTISRDVLPVDQRAEYVDSLFGVHYPLQLEPAIFNFADQLSSDYRAGYWEFYRLGNGGFYMAPDTDHSFALVCPNGYTGMLSADAFGITVCAYAFSHLSFMAGEAVARVYAEHYHLLREFVMEHPEVSAILAATD